VIFINTDESNFDATFGALLGRGKMDMEHVGKIVGDIIDEIKTDKNVALKQHISKFDNWSPSSDDDLKISTQSMALAYEKIYAKLRESLHLAYDRIKTYHQKQKPKSWFDTEENGTI